MALDLASLLAGIAAGKTVAELKAAAPRTPRAATLRKPLPPVLPLPKAFAERRTGYRVWQATARVVELQPQVCLCCSAETLAVKGEFFALENGQAHAVWLRPEGYGIEAPTDLPVETIRLPIRKVPVCGHCAAVPDLYFPPKHPQMELSL